MKHAMPLYARIHESEYLHRFGSDAYDRVAVLNPDMVEARSRARAWLARQHHADCVRFDFDQTMKMYAERSLRTGAAMTDAESDAVNRIAARATELERAWGEQLDRCFLEVTDE